MSGARKSSDPPEQPPACGVGQADQDDKDEDCHLGQRDRTEVGAADHRGPGKEVHRVHGEHDVEERVEEIADVGLRPTLADGVDTTLIGRCLLYTSDAADE